MNWSLIAAVAGFVLGFFVLLPALVLSADYWMTRRREYKASLEGSYPIE